MHGIGRIPLTHTINDGNLDEIYKKGEDVIMIDKRFLKFDYQFILFPVFSS